MVSYAIAGDSTQSETENFSNLFDASSLSYLWQMSIFFSVQAKIMAVTGYFVILNCFVSLAEGFWLSPFLLGTVCLSTSPCILPTNLTAWWNMYILFSLPLLAESDIYFTIPWRVEGWANLGAAVTACKPCPWLYIAVVGLDMTLQSCMLLLYCALMIVDMHAVRLLTFMLAW